MSFDGIAPYYDWMEWILAGRKLQRMRTRWLDVVPAPRRALLAGEGHGKFIVELRRYASATEIVCLDSSEAMLSVARRRLEHSGLPCSQVRFVHAELGMPPASIGEFDLLVTHFFLDCFPPGQLANVVKGLAGVATIDAHWLLSDFYEPPGGVARLRARWILALMYAFFRRTTRLPARKLTPPDSFLASNGFCLQRRQLAEWGLLHADWWKRGIAAGSCPSV